MKSGIYAIINTSNNKIYVGQSKNIKSRINRHKSELKHGKHRNIYLQRECNKYGFESLKFEIIELCDLGELNAKERFYIEKFDSANYSKGLNLTNGGENTEWNDDARKRRSGAGNPMYGKTISKEHLEAVRIANLGKSDKLSADDVAIIKQRLLANENQQEIAKEYNVTYSTIHKIFCAKNWYWVLEELNEQLAKIKEQNRHNKKQFIKERNVNIIECFKQGYTRKEIAEMKCLSRDVVKTVLRKYQANTEVNSDVKKFESP